MILQDVNKGWQLSEMIACQPPLAVLNFKESRCSHQGLEESWLKHPCAMLQGRAPCRGTCLQAYGRRCFTCHMPNPKNCSFAADMGNAR